jgi:hypothetical protein
MASMGSASARSMVQQPAIAAASSKQLLNRVMRQDADPRGAGAGVWRDLFPRPEITLPIELKRELYHILSSDIARQLKRARSRKTTCSKTSR